MPSSSSAARRLALTAGYKSGKPVVVTEGCPERVAGAVTTRIGQLAGYKSGKPIVAVGGCRKNDMGSLPIDKKFFALLVGYRFGLPVFTIRCCDFSSATEDGPARPVPDDCAGWYCCSETGALVYLFNCAQVLAYQCGNSSSSRSGSLTSLASTGGSAGGSGSGASLSSASASPSASRSASLSASPSASGSGSASLSGASVSTSPRSASAVSGSASANPCCDWDSMPATIYLHIASSAGCLNGYTVALNKTGTGPPIHYDSGPKTDPCTGANTNWALDCAGGVWVLSKTAILCNNFPMVASASSCSPFTLTFPTKTLNTGGPACDGVADGSTITPTINTTP